MEKGKKFAGYSFLSKIRYFKRHIMYIICAFLFVSCGRYPSEVEKALSLAGDNRENLIAVLEHYKGEDSRKYDAACFLIVNMPYHESTVLLNVPPAYSAYFEKVDSIIRTYPDACRDDSIKRMLANEYASLPPPVEEPGRKDIEILTTQFLIDNIDAAFEEWQTSPLLKEFSFDEFKELILPYRSANEAHFGNKKDLRRLMYDKLSANGMDNIRKPIGRYKKYVRLQKSLNDYITSSAHIGTYDLFIPAFKMDCHNLAAITCNLFRACGMPVVYEFTPQWTDKDTRHYWCSSPDSTSTFRPYTPPYNNLGEDWETNLKYAGKVYRMTFGAQKDTPYFLKAEGENVPAVFRHAAIKDVTSDYHVCADVTLPAPPVQYNKLAYLSFFNTRGVNPVAWGCIDYKKREVRFRDVPVNMLFFPTYISDDGDLVEFDHPFMLRQDSATGKFYKEDVKCNIKKTVSLHLLRKYPLKPHLTSCRERVKGANLLAAHRVGGPYDTLYTIPHALIPYWQRFVLDNDKKYYCYKLHTKDDSPINIAEYEFLVDKGECRFCPQPSLLPVLDSLQRPSSESRYVKVKGIPMRSGPMRYQAFDENPDTYIESSWFGMEFPETVCVKAIQLYPRNARNEIEPGNRYRLLYYDSGEWKEHATSLSTYHYLDFDSVPGETIYWLQNLDQGKEELPFFYRHGRQVFINQYHR